MERDLMETRDNAQNVGRTERIVSMISGGILLGAAGVKRSTAFIPLALAGGYLLLRGITGHCYVYRLMDIDRSDRGIGGITVEEGVTINKPVEEVFSFFHNFENLPGFMNHLESVTVLDGRRSHWVAKAPLGQSVEWDAEIISEEPNAYIAWRALPGSQIPNAGWVRFKPAPEGRGTEVYVQMEYDPPGGSAGAAFAKLLGEEPQTQVHEDLRRLKQLLESGEIITVEGQPSGRR